MSEWLLEFGYEAQLATWLVASFLLYTIASQLAWQVRWYAPGAHSRTDTQDQDLDYDRYPVREDGSVGLLESLRHYLVNPWVEEALRFAYFLGIPFLAALSGLLGADLVGISGTEWAAGQSVQGFLWEDWAQGAAWAVVSILALVAVWLVARPIARGIGLRPVTLAFSGPLWQRLLHAFYDQVHWAFYRSGPILWLGDLYWGTFAGLALVLLETALNPVLWWALKSPETAGPPLFRLAMAWISALLFLATQNLWLALGVHLFLAALLGAAEPSPYPVADTVTE
jgi:hypothetical protein